MGFVTLFHNFANWTDTIIVFIPISVTNKRIWKAFWLLLLLVTTICFSLQAYLLIRDYLNYDKSTVIRLNYAESLPFPAVTICNLNPYKKSAVNNSPALQNLMTVYNYVTGKKIQQAQNNITSTPTTIEPTTQEVHIRQKRGCTTGTFNSSVIPPGYSQPQVYSVVCGGGPLLQFTTCNGSGPIVRSRKVPGGSWNSTMITQMEQAFYLCLMPAWCSGGCGSWPDALSILTGMTKCIQDNNISSPYPTSGSPTQNIPTFANALAEGVADNCSLLASNCNLWIFTKPNNPKYPGNWWSQECGGGKPYIFGCDSCSGGTYNHTGLLDGCGNFSAVLAARVVAAEDDSLCGTSSAACNGTNGACPYSYKNGCDGSEYQNFTCSILNCNPYSTTTTMHTTTDFDTTTETTTIDASTTDLTSTILSSTLATTTVAPTTTTATTTMATTTTPSTTTLSSTTTITATTATSSITPTTITTTLASTTLSTTTASPTSTTSSSSSTASSLSTSTSSSTTTPTTTSSTSTSALSSSTSTSATSITSTTVASSTTSSTTVSSSSTSTPLSTTTSTTSTSSSTSATSTTSTASSTMSTPTQVFSTSTTSTMAQTLSTTTNGATATTTTKPTTTMVSSTYQSPATTNSLATSTTPITSTTTLTTTPTPTTTPLKNTVSSSSSTTISSTNQSTAATALSSTAMPLAVAATSESTTTSAINNSALSSSAATLSPQSTSNALGVTTASINTKQGFSTQVSPSSNTNSTWTNSSSAAEITPTTSKVFIISTNTTSLSPLTPLGSAAPLPTTPIAFNSSNLISTSIASLETTMINNHGLTNLVTTSSINMQNSSTTAKGTPSNTSQNVANSGIGSTDSEAGISSPNPNDSLAFNSGPTKISNSGITESLPDTKDDLLTTNIAAVTNIDNDVSSRTTTIFGQDQELTTDSENSVQSKTSSDLYTEADKFGKITSFDPYFTNHQKSTRISDPFVDSYSTLARNTANGFDNTSLGQESDVTTISYSKNSANSNGSPISSQTTTNSNSNGKTALTTKDGPFTSTHPQTRSNENDRTTTNIFKNASSTNENGKSQFGMLTTSQNTQELAHSKNSTDFVTSSPIFPNNQTLSGSTNSSRNMNSSFTPSTPIFLEWSTSSSGKNVNTSINTSSTHGIGVTVNPNQNKTNQGSTLFSITTTSTTNYSLTDLGFAITCPTCFNISDLTPTQTAQLDQLSSLYGLNPDSSQVTIDANFQEALNYVSASMPESEREECGYSLTNLVQSCVIAGNPCDMAEDFTSTFDVDYGNCYTFNYRYPDIKYNTTRSGAPNGLRMLVMSEVSDYLTSTSEAGIKITLHSQDYSPYPNVEGYKFGVGVMAGIYVTYDMYTRLDAPFGSCSSLDKLQKLGQPFYYNGTYSTEGCFRSCFQDKLIANCSCADARIPIPSDTNVPFCSYLNETQEQCKTTYIAENGDYYAVQGCQCDLPCEEQAYDAQLFEATWPDGSFLYEYYCNQYNTTEECQQFYSKNAVKIEVSYARMGYQSSDETPVNNMFNLINNMAGNLGLWIGVSAITLAELLLVFLQIWLWCCTKTKELPDVPSLRYRNIEERSEREERTKMHDEHTQDAEKLESITNLKHAPENMLIYSNNMAPKNFENELGKRSPTSDRPSSASAVHPSPGYLDAPTKQDLYEDITPKSQYDSYLSTPKLVHESDLQHEPIP